MGRYIEWYTVELDGYLRGRLSDELRHDAVRELRNHFGDHAEELVAKGMDPESAEKAAIRTFGSPRKAALNLLQCDQSSRAGGILSTIAALVIIAGAVLYGLLAYDVFMQSWSHIPAFMLISILTPVLVISLIFGTLLGRKVAIAKYVSAWVAGILIVSGITLFGPERHFGGIEPSKFNVTIASWEKGRDTTSRLGGLVRQVRTLVQPYMPKSDAFHQNYSFPGDTRYKPNSTETKAAVARIQELAKQMVALDPVFATIGGTKTTGYLIPRDSSPSRKEFDYYSMHERGTNVQMGTMFPYLLVQLEYIDSVDDVLSAWQNSEVIQYGAQQFAYQISEQQQLIDEAKRKTAMGSLDVKAYIVGLTAGWTLLVLSVCMVTCWLITKVSSLSIRRSYHRLIA